MESTVYDLNRKSRPIVIAPHNEAWREQYMLVANRLRSILSTCALRIDHIGSTAVSGLAAKDLIDIQITVSDLDQIREFRKRMHDHGFTRGDGYRYDNFCGPGGDDPTEWRKCYFREPEGERRTHIHVREEGRLNQRYALLFRDFLRSNATVRSAYEIVKKRLAEIFPECIDGYLYIKDPFMDAVYEGALLWACSLRWEPDLDYQ